MIVLPSLFEEEVRGHKLVQALREDNESARFQRELLTLPEGERSLLIRMGAELSELDALLKPLQGR